MPYFTKQEARNAAQTARNARAIRGFGIESYDKVLNESLKAQASIDRFDIFLSHSMQDAEIVLGAMEILKNMGYKVYVDWVIDKQLSREKVNAETAQVLKDRMKQSQSLLYIATGNSSDSKWMPWELGYFDGIKPECIAVLPVLDSANSSFDGQEYLGLYPKVEKNKYSNGVDEIFIFDAGKRWSTLSKLTKGNPQWTRF